MNNSVITAIILLGLSFASFPAHAQTVKKWIDEDGITHYSDQEPAGEEAEVKEIEVPEAGVTEFGSKEIDKRIQKQLKLLEQDRKAREQAAKEKEKTKAIEEAIEREPLIAEEKKKKEGRSYHRGPFPRPPPGPFPRAPRSP